MKKVKTILISILCLLASTFAFWGCESQDFEVSFLKESFQIELGTTHNAFDFLDYDENLYDKIWFESGNSSIIKLTQKTQIDAEKVGTTILYACIGKIEEPIRLASCVFEVLPNKMPFNAPTNLTFNNENRTLTWNYVFAETGSEMIYASKYILEIKYNSEESQEYNVIGNSYGPLTKAGEYSIRIKTNNSGNFLASDYAKNSEGEYQYLNFCLATAPTEIEFNEATSVLKWNANMNPDGTRYFVFVNNENISGDNGISSCETVLNISNANEYQVYIEARPDFKAGYGRYSARSQRISFFRLERPTISFNNESASWQAQEYAIYYEVLITNVESDEQLRFETENNFFNFSSISAGNYTISVQAIGNLSEVEPSPLNLETYSLSGEIAISEFKKLETAALQYKEETNIFKVFNNNGHDVKFVFKNLSTGEETESLIVGSENEVNITFNFNGYAKYSVKAKVLANESINEVNGDFSTHFSLWSNSEADLKYVQKVQAPEIFYGENNGESYVGFNANKDSQIEYSLTMNGESTTPISEKTFNLGDTASLFGNAGIYEFKLITCKEIQNETFFINGEFEINVQKLTSPVGVALKQTSTAKNTSIEVVDNIIDLSKVQTTKIAINNIETTVFNSADNEFTVRAMFVSKSSFEFINGIKTFFTSSNELVCSYERLSAPTELTFNYETKQFSWENESADRFEIYIDENFKNTTNDIFFSYTEEKAYNFAVYALPEIVQVEMNKTGFLPSKVSEFEVLKASAASNLKLSLNEASGLVTASWKASTGLNNKTAFYDILVNESSVFGEGELNSLISETSYEFSLNTFETPKEYNIKIQVKDVNRSTGGEFYEPTANASVTLTKLSDILNVNIIPNAEHTGGTISAIDYNPIKMKGLKVTVDNGVSEFYSDNSYAFSNFENGNIRKFQIAYSGIFDSDLEKYYLNSEPFAFSISKLSSPINLDYNSEVFSWQTSDTHIYDQNNSPFEFKVYTTKQDNGEKSDEISTFDLQTTLNLSGAVKIWIYESTLNINSSGQISVNADDVVYLNSSAVSFSVDLEDVIEELKMNLTTVENKEKVLISWEFNSNTNSAQHPDYVLKFKIKVFSENKTLLDTSFLATEIYTGENNLYSHTIELSEFDEACDYTVQVSAFSNKTLLSPASEITITKLGSANYARLNDFDVRLQKNETEEISLIGATDVELSVSGNVSLNQNNYFNLLDLISSGEINPEETLEISVQILAILPENVENGHFYLNSEQTTFVFKRIENLVPEIDEDYEKISWSQKNGASSYELQISQGDEILGIIKGIEDTYISLNDSRLNQIISESGEYNISVRAVASQEQIISASSTDSDSAGYISGEFSGSVSLDKLAKIQEITISTEDNDDMSQKKVVISWPNVPNANKYDIYVSERSEELGNVVKTISAYSGAETFFETTEIFSNAGTYFVSIVAKGSNALSSSPSDQIKIVRLAPIEQESISLSSGLQLKWNETTQTSLNLLDFSYFIELYDLNNTIQYNGEVSQNSFNLADVNWINNYDGGDFYIKIKVKGNGTSENATGGVVTLSSEAKEREAYKLISPQINLESVSTENKLIVSSPGDTARFPDLIDFFVTVSFNGDNLITERLERDLGGANFQLGIFNFPETWEAGEYSFSIYSAVRKAETPNLIKSQIAECTIEKLASPNMPSIDAFILDDITQKTIRISWFAVAGTNQYLILINGEEAAIQGGTPMEQCFWVTDKFFQTAGQYKVEIKSMRQGAISSRPTNPIYAVRLNSITNAYITSEKEVKWNATTQTSGNFTYYCQLQDNNENIEGESSKDLTDTNYSGFESNGWLNDFEGGVFRISVYVVGNGSSVDNGTATLTSRKFQFSALKLYAPTIEIWPERLELKISNANEPLPFLSGKTINEISGLKFSVRYGSESDFAKDKDENNIDNLTYESAFIYPEAWEAGDYNFFAINFPNVTGLNNVIASKSSSKTATRLEKPTNLEFNREELENENDYTCDDDSNPEFLSETLKFSFDCVENANSYLILNGNNDSSFNPQINPQNNIITINIAGEFEELLNLYLNEKRNLKVVAKGSAGGVYIDSAPAEIEFKKLKQVESFNVRDGKINWNPVSNATAYLIKATDEKGVIRFWQSENQEITSSFLNGILDGLEVEGQISLNIKALGSLGDNIILDSSYCNIDIDFFKLQKPEEFQVYNGFLSCKPVENAVKYKIFVSSNDETFSYILEDYTEKFDLTTEDNRFIGFSEALYENLESETLYKVKIQAISEDASRVLYSDISDEINFKILSNVNEEGDICLELNPNGRLDQTRLRFKIAEHSYGLIQINDTKISIMYSDEEPFASSMETFAELNLPADFGGRYIQFSLASLGSSSLVEDSGTQFYYLNSAITKSSEFYVLETPHIRNDQGVIGWDKIVGAEGYYVYINDSLYNDNGDDNGGDNENGIYRLNYINLKDRYGSLTENTPINLKVIAVSDTLNTIFSAGGTLCCKITSEYLTEKEFKIDLYKLKAPEVFDIVDGSLVFSRGIFSLDEYDRNYLLGLLNVVEIIEGDEVVVEIGDFIDIQLEKYNDLMEYIRECFLSPLVIYSSYIGFGFPNFELCFDNQDTHEKYNFIINAKDFLTLTETQYDNLSNFRTLILNHVSEDDIFSKLDVVALTYQREHEPKERIAEINELIDLYKLLRLTVQGTIIDEFLELYNKPTTGWPNLNSIFNDLNETALIPGGNYVVTVRQRGNTRDWLNSNFNNNLNVFLPKAVRQIEIIEQDGDFLLLWNEADMPSTYSPLDGKKYILFGEDSTGKRYEILRTNGDSSGTGNRCQLNLSTLIDEGILTENIVKIFIVVAGDENSNEPEAGKYVLMGISSQKLNISILPRVSPNMDGGVLVWDTMPSVLKYEILVTSTTHDQFREEICGTSWAGDALEAGTYTIKIRAIGAIYGEGNARSYNLSGQFVQFNISKLSEMNVSVDKYGIFKWDSNNNAEGFLVEISGTDYKFVKTGGFDLKFESDYAGFHNYLFKAIGTTGSINLDSNTVYYLNSNFNNNQNGLFAAILPEIQTVWVEDGVIKFTPLEETSTINSEGREKVVGYRLKIETGIGKFYSTELTSQFFKDNSGNICFDFSEYGSEDIYNVTVQAYIYYRNEDGTIFENAKSLKNNETYHRLLGKAKSIEFEKIAAPSSIKIENGEIVWETVDGADGYIVEIFTNTTDKLVIKTTTLNTWWPDSPLIEPQNSYYVKVKAYAEDKVFSNYTTYYDFINAQRKEIKRLQPLENVVSTINTYTSEQGENFISFAYPASGLDMAFNLRYKTEIDGEFAYKLITDTDYYEIITYLNEIVTINISKLQNGGEIDFMQYQIQCVAKETSKYLKSQWGTTQTFAIPESVDEVFYDEVAFEFFWKHVGNNYSYIVLDEVLDSNENCIAIYKYNIKTDYYAGENYYKPRVLQVGTSAVETISYMPSVVGYQHRVSVAVCLDTTAESSLVSQFTQCESLCELNIFEVESDILAEDSSIYNTNDIEIIAQYLLDHAYGTESNPYLCESAEDIEKINLRLLRYSYSYNYSVELHFEHDGEQVEILTNISEINENYCFKQTADIIELSKPIGTYTDSGGSIKYQSFQNTFDGNNKTISIEITAPRTDLHLGLFMSLGNGAVVKNLSVNASVDFNKIQGSTFTFGAIAGRNNGGSIVDCYVRSIEVEGLTDNNNHGVYSLTFGGVVGENIRGRIEQCITSSEIELNLLLANNGTAIYVGGIAGKNSGTIINSGNNAKINATGKTYADIGGVVGRNTGDVLQAYNKSQIVGTTLSNSSELNIGGIVGKNSGTIKNSYNVGNVSCQSGLSIAINLGGIVGHSEVLSVTNCYSTMSSAVSNVGVLKAGTIAGRIEQSISSEFGPENIYINDQAVGYVNGSGIFAIQISEEELREYAGSLNIAAEEEIFENTENYPRFKWEQNFVF